ncbi:MAG: CsgG/HfaB family protein [Spirochaetes bacterium]|nr:CsgG/HfaB family protein [Spirochaetota bacterium]
MLKRSILIVIILLMVSGLQAEKMRIAIMDLQAMDVSKNTARAVSELIRTELFNTGYFRVVERSEMNSILKEQGLQFTGCTETECAVQVGKLLSARKILVGSVSKLGTSFIINARIVDVERGEMEFGDKAKAESESELDKAVERFARKLAGRIKAKQSGEVVEEEEEEKEVEPSGTGTGGKSINFMGKAGLGLMGVGVVSGVISFIYNGKANTAYDEYSAIILDEETRIWTVEDWDYEWERVTSAQSTRNLFFWIAVGAGGAGLTLFVIDYFFIHDSTSTAWNDQPTGLNFAFYDQYKVEYNYRW